MKLYFSKYERFLTISELYEQPARNTIIHIGGA